MVGDSLRAWFELFDGIVIYRQGETAGWINYSDIEDRFKSEGLKFSGRQYTPDDKEQRNALLDSIITYASLFVACKLLERRKRLVPISRDYRLTNFGRRIGNWGYGEKAYVKKRVFFMIMAVGLKLYKFRKVVTVGAIGWSALNAFKFYYAALSWAETLPFALWTASATVALITLWAIIKPKD